MAILTPKAVEQVEYLIDKFGLTSVLQSIAEICEEQASMFRKGGEHDSAKVYDEGARIVDCAATESEHLRI